MKLLHQEKVNTKSEESNVSSGIFGLSGKPEIEYY